MVEIKKLPANAFALFFVRAGVLGVVALLCSVTFWYCTSVYFDQNAALQNLLECATGVMNESNTVHWLDRGTLLGARRNKRFVVWDGDVTLGAVSNFTGSLYEVMSEVSSQCDLHFHLPEGFEVPSMPSAPSQENVKQMVWYLYNAHVGLRVLEWTPMNHQEHDESIVTGASLASTGASLATAAGSAITAAVLSHGSNLIHSFDTLFPLQPCELHAFSASCPNNETAVLESHFGGEWLNATLMSLFH